MNKINLILVTVILLIFILYVVNNCKNEEINTNKILEPFQPVTLNMLAGLNNDGNNGASGGGAAGGLGNASSTTKSNGGLPLTNVSGKAGGDAFDTHSRGGGGGGFSSAGYDNNDASNSGANAGKGGLGVTSLSVETSLSTSATASTTSTFRYCVGGDGGVSSSTTYVGPVAFNEKFYGCGGNGASNKANTAGIVSYNGDNGTYGVVYIVFLNTSNVALTTGSTSFTSTTTSTTPATATTSILQSIFNALRVNILNNSTSAVNVNLNGNNPNNGCDFNFSASSNYLKFYIPINNPINKIDYIITFDTSFANTAGNQIINCNIHVVGGGGGGGGCFENSRTGGGGGAGQYVTSANIKLATNGTHYITVGNGGRGGMGNNNGNDGNDTIVSLNTSSTTTDTTILNYIASGGGGGAGGGVTNNSKNEDLIKKLIRKIYVADVDAIRNLSNYASRILSGGLQIDGRLRIADRVVLITGTELGPPRNISDLTGANSVNLNTGDIGTKIVLRPGASGIANAAFHPYALGMNNNEMWFGMPFTQGNTLTFAASGTRFTNTVTTVAAGQVIPKDYNNTVVPNKFNWYSGNRGILILDSNSNLILSPNTVGHIIPTVTSTGTGERVPPANTLYTVYLNIGTYAEGSLLSFSGNALNINSNVTLTTNSLTCGAITCSAITCGASNTLSLGGHTINCGPINCGLINSNGLRINNDGTLIFNNQINDMRIQMWEGYGFGVNGGTLRYNSASHHRFYANGSNTVTFDNGGGIHCNGISSGGSISTGGNVHTNNVYINNGCRIQCVDGNHFISITQSTNTMQLQEYGVIKCTIGPSLNERLLIHDGGINVTGNISCSGQISCGDIRTSGAIFLRQGWSIQTSGDYTLTFYRTNPGVSCNSAWWFAGYECYWGRISDNRIKKNINCINNSIDIINNLNPKSFNLLIDKDNNKRYGFIAQDVIKILPDIINKESDYIADIFTMGTIKEKIITIDKNIKSILKVGIKIKLVFDNNEKHNKKLIGATNEYNRYHRVYVNVTRIINNYSFEINQELEPYYTTTFVYGTHVNDFHTIDYNSIFSLNVAATQELYKEHIQLKEEHNELKEKFNILLKKLQLSF